MTKAHNGKNLYWHTAAILANNVKKWSLEDKKGLRVYNGTLENLTICLEKDYPSKNKNAMLKVYFDGVCLYEGDTIDEQYDINEIFDSVDKQFGDNKLSNGLNHVEEWFKKYNDFVKAKEEAEGFSYEP